VLTEVKTLRILILRMVNMGKVIVFNKQRVDLKSYTIAKCQNWNSHFKTGIYLVASKLDTMLYITSTVTDIKVLSQG
jgi:hypothetical protein